MPLRYAVIDIDGSDCRVGLREHRPMTSRSLSGVVEVLGASLRRQGFGSAYAVAALAPKLAAECMGPKRGPAIHARARARVMAEPIPLDAPDLPEPIVWLDLEGEARQPFLACFCADQGGAETVVADEPSDTRAFLRQLDAAVGLLAGAIATLGSSDRATLAPAFRAVPEWVSDAAR